jgi:mono/diheme cytochrome c family protein
MRISAAIALLMLLAACRNDMHDQPKYKDLGQSRLFADGRASRPIPANTVSRDERDVSDVYHTGNSGNDFSPTIPVNVDLALLQRGHERFDIFCSPCHGRLGDGNGMVAQRGFRIPQNLVSDRVRQEPPGYIFQVISYGFGGMPDHRDQIPIQDRWAIVAYLRALQLSRGATAADVPAEDRAQLESQQ